MINYDNLIKRVSEMVPLNQNNILIIDGTNTFIRVFCNVPTLNENGDHVGAIIGFLKSIGHTIRTFKPSKCIIVFDGKGGSTRRKKLYPLYKGNRTPKKMNRFEEFADLMDEDASKKYQASRLLSYLDCLPVTVITADNIEADDSISYITSLYPDKKIIISSTDRDFLQLINENITVYNPIKKVIYNEKKVEEEFGLHSKNYLYYRILTGDSSDNIPGVPGVGLKTLIKIVPELIERPMSLKDIIDICSKNKLRSAQNVLNNINQIQLNEKLMRLDLLDFAVHTKLMIQNLLANKTIFDKKEFLRLFFEDQLQFHLKDPHSWMQNTFNKLFISNK